MARESQDLQIALIVSVMLTIILGVTTFLCYRQYSDTAKTLKTTQDDLFKKQQDAQTARDEVNRLKRFLGVAETESIDEVQKQFDDDMKKFGGSYSQEAQFYRPLVEKLSQTVQDKNKDLVTTKDENQQLKDKYEIRESTKDAQLKQFEESVNRANQEKNELTAAFNKDRDRITGDENKIKDQLQSARKETETSVTKFKSANDEIGSQLKKTQQLAKKLREENAVLTNPQMDVPDGEVRWVNQRSGTVWIDVGHEDNLNTLTTFSIYPADAINLGRGDKKGSIEVTQILGDHLAEARIIDDKTSDPIMPGDKIHTPIWSPGDKRHFALAGFMDVNDDGKNSLQLLRNLININGGIVDCEVDEKGKKSGEISLKTKYLILGDNPSEKGDASSATAYSKLLSEAENLGVQKISLKELLERMGYKSQARVVNFGPGLNPNDFKPKPESGVNRVSGGNVSELYKPRQPPRSGSGGAY